MALRSVKFTLHQRLWDFPGDLTAHLVLARGNVACKARPGSLQAGFGSYGGNACRRFIMCRTKSSRTLFATTVLVAKAFRMSNTTKKATFPGHLPSSRTRSINLEDTKRPLLGLKSQNTKQELGHPEFAGAPGLGPQGPVKGLRVYRNIQGGYLMSILNKDIEGFYSIYKDFTTVSGDYVQIQVSNRET